MEITNINDICLVLSVSIDFVEEVSNNHVYAQCQRLPEHFGGHLADCPIHSS